MVGKDITFVSLNVRGLANQSKRADTLNYLKSKNFSVYFLQETHFTTKEENYIRAQWGYDCFFSNFSSQAKGVAILFNNNFEYKIHEIKKDEEYEGSKLMLDVTIEDKRTLLVNIYGPNRDDPHFYSSALADIIPFDIPVIIAGDFNLVLNPEVDSYNYKHVNNPDSREIVLDMLIDYNMVDVWRELNLEDKQFTWRRKNTNQKARLDYFLISESLLVETTNAKIMPGYRTDHSIIYLQFNFGKFEKGTSYWKFNNSLLKDLKYVEKVKKTILNVKEQYASVNQNQNIDIKDIPIQDLNLAINDQLFFEVLMMEIRGESISFSSHSKKQEKILEEELEQEIETLEKEEITDHSLLEKKQDELLKLRQKKMEGVKIRSRARWICEGEKATKYFCNLETRHFVSKSMNSLISNEGIVLQNQKEILDETMIFYKKLYSKREITNIDLCDIFNVDVIPVLTEEMKNKLEGPLLYSELLFCLKKASNNTSPGFDGFSYEFFKFFWSDLGYFMLRALNYGFRNGELSESQKQGVITCIPKGNKDKKLLKNWRPISLLNTTYKLASACIAERLKNVLPTIINEDQTGFISGRYMGENLRLIYDLIEYTKENHIPGLLLLIDFEKAFDSVSWEFMFKVLDFYNFGLSFKNWIKTFYLNIQSCVLVNGCLSDWFYIQRGCRQGDPLSPYLFILCAEILAHLIRNNGNILGVKIGNVEYLISQYADDTTLILDGSTKSLVNCLKVLKFYADASGLYINLDKTKVVWIGSKSDSQEKLCESYNLCWVFDEFTVLGIIFPKDLVDIVNRNYLPKLEEIKRLLSNWSKRILTPIGRITVIKSLAMSKINHLVLALPSPSDNIMKELQNMFYKYLWSNGPDRIKRKVITQSVDNGGLRMIDVEKFICALKVTWIRRVINDCSKYINILDTSFPFIKEYVQFGNNFIVTKLPRIYNTFWKDVFQSYGTFLKQIQPTSWSEFLQCPLWFNDNLKVGGKPVYFKQWYEKGICFVNDLVDNSGNLKTWRQVQNEFYIRTNFLQYESILNCVRAYQRKLNIKKMITNLIQPLVPFPLAIVLKSKKGCRLIYDQLIYIHCQPKVVQKWSNEILISENLKWESIFNLPFGLTKDTQVRWFQFRINHRILGTNCLLYRMKKANMEHCTFCNEEMETIKHLFWECIYTVNFWNDFKSFIKDKNVNINTDWSITDVLFGNPEYKDPLNLILIKAKQFIFNMKMKKVLPMMDNFKPVLLSFYRTEKYIAKCAFNFTSFEEKWYSLRELFV